MIIKEQINDRLTITYSDEGFMLLRVDNGALYEEAIDPVDIVREYIETDIKIELEELETEELGEDLIH